MLLLITIPFFFSPHLAKILTSELINKGRLPGNSKPELTLLEYEEKIRKIIGTHLNADNEEKEKGTSEENFVS